MNNLSFCWNCWIRCIEIYVICVALIFFIAFLFCCFPQYRGIFHIYTSCLCPYSGCGSCGRYFLFLLYGLFRRTGEYRTPKPLFPSQVEWVCAACNRRKIQCLLCLSHGLAVLGATAQWLRCIVHLCRSFLGFLVLLLNYILHWRFMSFLLAMQR